VVHGVVLGWIVHCADDTAPRRASAGERASDPSSDARAGAAIELVPVELAAVERSPVELVLVPD
jgi:hypothetical protein